ncbi:hypothetical protein [Oscillatoria sp. FACHB-1406]|uniref:hypothetical protein n=1 Tax=Oscillatoria sp. FACHB-1406 TaxID=2692846 RepID=UPI00168799F4|nr:hypothetical protein [Oscillatoria sp. FACHB-1406]MBD2578386.1 hypothetical protein [Oscillatoria sp. FACHB-1406]
MKKISFARNQVLLLGFILLFLGWELAIPSKVYAQTETLTEPTQITVVGMRGTVVTRNLFLRTATPITKLDLIPLDLNRGDGGSVFPAQAIALENISRDETKPNAIAARLKFNLQQTSSGEFTGKLRLSYENGEEAIPVTIKVKDPWFLPLLILVLGTILGVSVSMYRSQGRPRDEILVRVSQLRAQMQEDAEFAEFKSFKSRLDSFLVDVRMALQGERWEDAQNTLAQAELVSNKWIKGREDWSAQLDYYKKIEQRLDGLDENLPFVQGVARGLEDAMRDAPDLESPVKLRDRLQEIAEQVNVYLPLQTQLKELLDLSTQLSEESAQSWQPKIQSLQKQIVNLKPADLAQSAALEAELETAIAEIAEQIARQTDSLSFGINDMEDPRKGSQFRSAVVNLLAPAPSTRTLSWEEQASGANKRLQIFTVTSYVIAIAFLAGAGFSQLYIDKPTFGDNPWKDYFALLAWGFGAEATRDAVTKVVQGWGLPGLK